jgi:hypothetical protein
MTTTERDALIRARLAKVPAMTAEQRARQRESFAVGNVKIDRELTPESAPTAKR